LIEGWICVLRRSAINKNTAGEIMASNPTQNTMNTIKHIFYKIRSVTLLGIDTIYKFLLFGDFFRVAFRSIMLRYIRKTKIKQQKTLNLLKEKPNITVLFFMQHPSVWKYDVLYKKMSASNYFKPIVVICPYNVHLYYSKREYMNVMKQSEEYAKNKEYNYISAYDMARGKWIDVRKMFDPDIVFFTKPYKDTRPEYYIYKFRDKITCYVPYGTELLNTTLQLTSNLPLHNLLYHYFVETECNRNLIENNSLIKGQNVTVVSSLGSECLMDKTYIPNDVWKAQNKRKKRIIWSPHHTIDYMFNFSNFLFYCEKMLSLAKKYEDKIQFAFKPHPVLKFKLIGIWGQQKTDEYYNRWQEMPNTQIADSDYNDLFLTSDAMIHDSVSFMFEYIHTVKPVCFTVKNKEVQKQFNILGEKCFDIHYHAYNEQDIEKFIQNVVLDGNDIIYNERKIFFNEYLYPKDGIMPSEKIYKILENKTR
jgi:hypothetical protein